MEPAHVVPFDLARMLVGEFDPLFLLEVAVRVGLIYCVTVLLLSLMAKRGRREMTPFEFIVIIALGSVIGDSMFRADVPLAYVVIVTLGVVALTWLFSKFQYRFPPVRRFLAGSAREIVRDGKLLDDALEAEKITKAELFSHLREKDVANLGEIDRAFVELSGKLSVFKRAEPLAGESTLPPRD